MIKFKFNNTTINAPDCWEEVTVAMFCHPYFLTRDSVGMLSALTGIEKGLLMNTNADLKEPLNKMVTFIAEDPEGYKKLKINPIKVQWGGKEVSCKIPKDIELEKLGQKIMMEAAMGKHKFVYQGIPEAVAIYIIPSINGGEFDDEHLEDLTEQVRGLSITDVFPVADFFLGSWRSLTRNGIPS